MRSIIQAVSTAALVGAGLVNAQQNKLVGGGRVRIYNNCKSDIQINSCYDSSNGNLGVGPANGGSGFILKAGHSDYSQEWWALVNGAMSIKMKDLDNSQNCGTGSNAPVFQFEYRLSTLDNHLWWDASSVDNNPWAGNWAIRTSNDNGNNPPWNPAKGHSYQCTTDDQLSMHYYETPDINIDVLLCSKNQNTHFLSTMSRPKCDATPLSCNNRPSGYGPGVDYGALPSSQWPACDGSGSGSQSQASSPAPAAQAQSSPSVAASSSNAAAAASSSPSGVVVGQANVAPAATTLVPVTTPAAPQVVVETVMETAVVTVYANDMRRRHVHGHAKRA